MDIDNEKHGLLIKHFILGDDGSITEFNSDQAYAVANGQDTLPQYAGTRLRYVQVQFDEEQFREVAEEELQVRTAGAYISFDPQGRLSEAGAPDDGAISSFEHDTCVQLALRDTLPEYIIHH